MTYNVTKATPNSNPVVNELNAAVATSTFCNRTGLQKAELWKCKNSSDLITGAGTCPPVNSEFGMNLVINFTTLN